MNRYFMHDMDYQHNCEDREHGYESSVNSFEQGHRHRSGLLGRSVSRDRSRLRDCNNSQNYPRSSNSSVTRIMQRNGKYNQDVGKEERTNKLLVQPMKSEQRTVIWSLLPYSNISLLKSSHLPRVTSTPSSFSPPPALYMGSRRCCFSDSSN